MKKVFYVFRESVILLLFFSLFSCATIKKEEIVYIDRDYVSEFNTLVNKGDEEGIVTLLKEWEEEDKKDPELLSFKTQYYISKAYSFEKHVSKTHPKEGLPFTMDYDKEGNVIYNTKVPVVYDEPFEKAIETAKRGIELYPSRIDFYVNQIILYQAVLKYEDAKNVMMDILKQTQKEGNVWRTNDNKLLFNDKFTDKKNQVMFIELLYDIACREWFYVGSPFTNTLLGEVYREIEKTYPNNAHIYLIIGSDLLSVHKVEEGERYLLKAYEMENDNLGVVRNLACIYSVINVDKTKAMKYINILIESNDELYVNEGKNFLNVLNGNKQ